ncbi:MAG: hypothetical protein ACRDTJ_09775, partial [Pseudonocardiaceae bacterium]
MRLTRLNLSREATIPDLLELLARRPELRDVGIAGYLVGAAVDGGPGMPPMRGSFWLETRNGPV